MYTDVWVVGRPAPLSQCLPYPYPFLFLPVYGWSLIATSTLTAIHILETHCISSIQLSWSDICLCTHWNSCFLCLFEHGIIPIGMWGQELPVIIILYFIFYSLLFIAYCLFSFLCYDIFFLLSCTYSVVLKHTSTAHVSNRWLS